MQSADFKISRIHKIEGDTKLKAFVDVSIAGVVIKGFKVVDGSKGLFLSMPRHQGKDGKWYDTVYPSTKEIRAELNNLVLVAYEE